MKNLVLIFFITFNASAVENLIVKKRIPVSSEEIQLAQNQSWFSLEEKIPFDDSYSARMQAYRENKARSRMVNGARSSGSATPLMIPILWGTFD